MCRYLALVLPLAFTACGHGKDAADRRFDELGSQILRLQADQDSLEGRLGALEGAEAARQEESAKRAEAGQGPEQRPRLRVVKVTPPHDANQDDAPPADEVDPPGSEPRPVVRTVGQSVTVQNLN